MIDAKARIDELVEIKKLIEITKSKCGENAPAEYAFRQVMRIIDERIDDYENSAEMIFNP